MEFKVVYASCQLPRGRGDLSLIKIQQKFEVTQAYAPILEFQFTQKKKMHMLIFLAFL